MRNNLKNKEVVTDLEEYFAVSDNIDEDYKTCILVNNFKELDEEVVVAFAYGYDSNSSKYLYYKHSLIKDPNSSDFYYTDDPADCWIEEVSSLLNVAKNAADDVYSLITETTSKSQIIDLLDTYVEDTLLIKNRTNIEDGSNMNIDSIIYKYILYLIRQKVKVNKI